MIDKAIQVADFKGFDRTKNVQEQLQAMAGDMVQHKNWLYWLTEGDDPFYGTEKEHRGWEQFSSFEQIWLAIVMMEKYSKWWDGNEWV